MSAQIERINEIEKTLLDLGNIAGWRSDIHDQTGDLILYLPQQFHWRETLHDGPDAFTVDGMWLGNMEGSSQADHALLDFLGQAPEAQRWLLQELKAAVSTLQHIAALRRSALSHADDGIDTALSQYFAPEKGRI